MAYDEDILGAVGNTPLVHLARIDRDLPATILAKLEFMNPGGSHKDRIAVAMIDQAERSGALVPGATIVEATAGNTGVGLAMVAAVRGYRCVFAVPDKMSTEKVALLKAYGAEVVTTRTDVPPDSPLSYDSVAERLLREIPGSWRPRQFANAVNPATHYSVTGPEIWRQSGAHVDTFVAGVGTGGSISGIARYLKEQNPNLKVIGADPIGSILSGGDAGSWNVEGIGEDYFTDTYDASVVDRWERVSDADSFAAARRLAREEGILAGGSAGTALHAAIEAARTAVEGSVIVVFLPDTGRNYLTKLHSDEWMMQQDFWSGETSDITCAKVLAHKRGMPPLVSVRPETRACDVARMMTAYGISYVPVTDNGMIFGDVDDLTLLHLVHGGADLSVLQVKDLMRQTLPLLDENESVDRAYRILGGGPAGVIITRGGYALGFLSRSDLIDYWADRAHVEEFSL
jgi:cystathionine beta-synthase